MLNHKFLAAAVDEIAKTFKPGDVVKNKAGDAFILAEDGKTWIPLDSPLLELKEERKHHG